LFEGEKFNEQWSGIDVNRAITLCRTILFKIVLLSHMSKLRGGKGEKMSTTEVMRKAFALAESQLSSYKSLTNPQSTPKQSSTASMSAKITQTSKQEKK
jgi:hypothetical protein